jgi:hypothetical protein
MDESDASDEIARLEARIAALTESLDRCRKIGLGAKIVLAAGAAWILLMLIGALPFGRLNLVGAITAVLGGIVLFGSNSSTGKQTEAALDQAEALRADLIGRMELRVIEGEPRVLH